MQGFEVLPIGTTQYIKDLELQLSLLRKFEDKVTGDVVHKVASGIVWMDETEITGHTDEGSSTFSEAADISEELQRDRDRLDWILDNASIRGGGDGFTIKVFVPVDCECVRTGIDLAMEGKYD